MITLRLRGSLAACLRAESTEEALELEARSAGEALRLVAPQSPGFGARLRAGAWRIAVDGRPIGPAELDMLLPDGACVAVAPALAGAAFVGPQVWWTLGTLVAGWALGEITAPRIPDMDPDDLSSGRRSLFSGPLNSASQGGAVPLIYGTVRVGSTVVSGGITPDRPTGGENASPAAIGLGGQPAGGQPQLPAEDRHDPFQDAPLPGAASRASSTLRVVDLLGEGEIDGLVDGLRSVFIDGVAVEDEDGEPAVEGVTVQVRRGLAHGDSGQEPLAGFAVTATGLGHAREKVVHATPAIHEVPAGYDAARVTLRWPRLLQYDERDGEIATEVTFRVASRPAGGAWETVLTQTIRDLSLDERELAWRVERPEIVGEDDRWEIRVSRDTEDSTSTQVQDEFWWQRTAGLRDVKQTYPRSAVAGLVIETERTDLNPTRREYEVRGRRVLTPPDSVWDPGAPTATSAARYGAGLWDGTMVRRWTDNPAWCLYDLLVDRRAGLGGVPGMVEAARAARGAFLEWSRRCDELVPAPDSEAEMEPRWRFNAAITKREQARKVLDWASSASRVGLSWGAGRVVVAIDGESDVAAAIGNANVIDGAFEYQGPRWQERHSAVGVTWQNPEDGYRPTIELVQDNGLVARHGHRQRDVAAVGCTSRGQAHRTGLLALAEQENESETVRFRMALEGLHLRPGDRIRIADEQRFEVAGAFRLRSVDTSTPGQETLTLDRPAPRLAAGGRIAWGAGREAAVARAVGQGDDVLVTTDMPTGLAPGDLVVNAAAAIDWIVTGLTERDRAEASIEARRHDPRKYEAVEQRRMLAPPLVDPVARMLPPTAVTVIERTYADRNVVRSLLEIGVRGGDDPRIAQVEYEVQKPKRKALPAEIAAADWSVLPRGPWEPLRITPARSIVERDVALGGYRVRARFLGARRRSDWAVSPPVVADGKTDGLTAPEGLAAEGIAGGYFVDWMRPAAADYSYAEIWDTAGDAGPADADVDVEDGTWTLRHTTAGTGWARVTVTSTDPLRVAVRFVDTSDLASAAREVGVTPREAIEGADGRDGGGVEYAFMALAADVDPAIPAGALAWRFDQPQDGWTDGAGALVGPARPYLQRITRGVAGTPAAGASPFDGAGRLKDGWTGWRLDGRWRAFGIDAPPAPTALAFAMSWREYDVGGGQGIHRVHTGALTWTDAAEADGADVVLELVDGVSGSSPVRNGLTGGSLALALVLSPEGVGTRWLATVRAYRVFAGRRYVSGGVAIETMSTEGASTAIGPPGGMRLVAGDGQVEVFWGPADNATAYDLERQIANSNDWTRLVSNGAAGAEHTDRTVVNGTSYQYRVRGRAGALVGAWLDPRFIVTPTASPPPTAPPGAPRNVSLVADGQNAADGDWDAPSTWGTGSNRVYQFRLYRGATLVESGSPAAAGGQRFTNLVPGTTYRLDVRCETTHGSSGWASDSATTDSMPVTPSCVWSPWESGVGFPYGVARLPAGTDVGAAALEAAGVAAWWDTAFVPPALWDGSGLWSGSTQYGVMCTKDVVIDGTLRRIQVFQCYGTAANRMRRTDTDAYYNTTLSHLRQGDLNQARTGAFDFVDAVLTSGATNRPAGLGATRGISFLRWVRTPGAPDGCGTQTMLFLPNGVGSLLIRRRTYGPPS